MKYRDLLSDLIHRLNGQQIVLSSIFAAFLFSTSFAPSIYSQSSRSDEVRSLVKKAAKLARSGSYSDAESHLRRAVDLAPNQSDIKIELAYLLVKERKLLDAFNICLPIVEAERTNSHAYAVMGVTLLAAGRFPESRGFFNNAVNFNAREHLAWAGLGLLDFYENNIDQGLDRLTRALYIKPDDPDYLFATAQAFGRAERFNAAADKYERFLSVTTGIESDRRERIQGLVRFLRLLGQTGKLYVNGGSDETKVPFELVGDRPVIELKVNDRPEPLKFVLDTGSGISVISDETAKRLKVKPITKGGYAKGIGGDGKFEIVYGLLKKVSVGNVNVKNVPVYLRKFHNTGQPVDGYIGLALISKFLTTIDYGQKTFTLTKKDDDTRAFQKNDELSLPLRLTSSGFLSGEVQLEGIDSILNFIVDTGASVSVISNRVAKAEAISPFASEEKLRVFGSAGFTDDVSSFLLPSITFGNHTRKSIMAVALDLDIINEASGFEQAGILGGNFLKNYRLTFDFKNSKVVFESIKAEN